MNVNITDEHGSDWELLKESFPPNWKEIAENCLSRAMRSFDAVECLIRALLIHIICGKALLFWARFITPNYAAYKTSGL